MGGFIIMEFYIIVFELITIGFYILNTILNL